VPRLINGEDAIRRLFEEAAMPLAHSLTITLEDSAAPSTECTRDHPRVNCAWR
jgi:hypothetical protein